jgi:hypothetical protein
LEFKEFQNSRQCTNRENSSLDVTPSFKLTDNEFYTNSNSDEFVNNNQNNKNLDLTSTSNIFNNLTNNSQVAFVSNNEFCNNVNNTSNNLYQNTNNIYNQNAINNNGNNKENYIFLKYPNHHLNSSKKFTSGNNINNNEFAAGNVTLNNISNSMQVNNNIQFKEKSSINLINNLIDISNQNIKNKNFNCEFSNNQNYIYIGKNEAFIGNTLNNNNLTNKNTLSSPLMNKILKKKSFNKSLLGFPYASSFSGTSVVKDIKSIPGNLKLNLNIFILNFRKKF